jgi:hypothetical protein
MCALCMHLPGRSQGAEGLAATIINGHAACFRHYEFVAVTAPWEEILRAAEEWEAAIFRGDG